MPNSYPRAGFATSIFFRGKCGARLRGIDKGGIFASIGKEFVMQNDSDTVKGFENASRGAGFVVFLAAALVAAFVWSGINPYSRGVWYVEISSVLIVFLALVFTFKKFRFSNASYAIISVWLFMHTVGAHYSFELVPFGFITDLFGFERNHYDRVAHFAIGLNAYGVAEFVLRKSVVNSAKAAAFFGVLFIMAMANAWELIEWGYAEADGGEVGAAFLGSQGDVWDAQKDMLCDSIGAAISAFAFVFFAKRRVVEKQK